MTISRDRTVTVTVPADEIHAAIGPMAFNMKVRDDNYIWVWYNDEDGPAGIVIPIGIVVDAVKKLVKAAYRKSKKKLGAHG